MFLARWTRICHLAETRPTYRTCIGLMRRMHRCNRVLRQIRQIVCRSRLFRHRAEARSLHRMLMRRTHHRHLAVTRLCRVQLPSFFLSATHRHLVVPFLLPTTGHHHLRALHFRRRRSVDSLVVHLLRHSCLGHRQPGLLFPRPTLILTR